MDAPPFSIADKASWRPKAPGPAVDDAAVLDRFATFLFGAAALGLVAARRLRPVVDAVALFFVAALDFFDVDAARLLVRVDDLVARLLRRGGAFSGARVSSFSSPSLSGARRRRMEISSCKASTSQVLKPSPKSL